METTDIGESLGSGDILIDPDGDACIVSLGINQSSTVNRLVYLCGYVVERKTASELLEYCKKKGIKRVMGTFTHHID